MYSRPNRRRASNGLAGARARQMLAGHHNGPAGEFLRRHEQEAKQAQQGSRREQEAFAHRLLERAGDNRNVAIAIEHCASHGQAAGPNGLKPSELDDEARWALARELSHMIRNRTFSPSESRTIWIDKGSGRGRRPIRIQNLEHRCVERAILQIIRPITNAQYDNHSMGFRCPGISRETALATAEHWALTHNQWTWISEDLRDAFEHVPTRRLSQILLRMFHNTEFCEFIERIVLNRNGRGIRQGGPLSPELLNLYLHWVLDREWRQTFPNNPLFRVADDLLILCHPEKAHDFYQALHQLAISIGMPLKGSILTSIHDLTRDQTLDWLGYQIQRGESGIRIDIGGKSWDKLEEHIRLAWEASIPSLAVNETIRGWISQQGATYRESSCESIYAEISRIAYTHGFQEIPSRNEITLLWSRAYDRDWVLAREIVSNPNHPNRVLAGASASQHSESAAVLGCGNVARSTASPPQITTRRREVFLFSDGSCLRPHGVGAWGYLLIDQQTGFQCHNGGTELHTTNNRMELMAVIQGLSSLAESSTVHIFSDSQYVVFGITDWLRRWIAQGWRSCGRRSAQIANVDLWQRLAEQLQRHVFDCEWIRGHSGHPENEFVDQMVNGIAHQFQEEQTGGFGAASTERSPARP